jgi:hypothetical protein
MGTPGAAIWSRSLGWLAAVFASSWLTRMLWILWNRLAMEDAQRGDCRVRRPLGVLLALFVQVLLTAVAVMPFEYAFSVAAVGVLVLLIGVVGAQARHPMPRGPRSAARDEPSSSAVTVLRALMNLVGVGATIAAVPIAFFFGALRSQEYLSPRIGAGASWAVAGAVGLVGAVIFVVVARAALAAFKEE